MKKPAKCVTPKRDRYEYTLNARDLRNLMALVQEAYDILTYYIVMPENKTGELAITRADDFEELSHRVDGLKILIDDVNWR